MVAFESRSRAFPHQFAWLLNNPVRGLLLSPRTLVRRICLRPTDQVLEIGPGPGYFSVALAAAVPQGHLELMDVQPEMLAKARVRLSARKLSNVSYVVADAGSAWSPAPARFDVAVLVAVLGEIADQVQCLRGLAHALRRGGKLAIHEGWPDPDRIPLPALRQLVEAHGFELTQVAGRKSNFTAIFRRG